MQRVGFVVIPSFQLLSLAAVSVFEFANIALGKSHYEVRLLSERGGGVTSSFGMSIDTRPLEPGSFDTLIVGAGIGPPVATSELLAFLRAAAPLTRRIAAVCNATFLLAEAGLLDGRRATTHWRHAPALQARFPAIKVEEDRIFIVDGSIWTSAGATAAIDLALAMVEKDLGLDVSHRVAQSLIVYHRRAGGQSQHSALLEMTPKSDRIQDALAYALLHLGDPILVAQLANAARLSPRQFSRAFRAETGRSPAKAVEQLRVEAARLMIEQSRLSMNEVARETGFSHEERMRRAFLRAFGQPPQTIRRNSRAVDIEVISDPIANQPVPL